MPHLHPAHLADPSAYPSVLDRYAAQAGLPRTPRDPSRTPDARRATVDRQQERRAKAAVRTAPVFGKGVPRG